MIDRIESGRGWRIMRWTATAGLLLIPAVAMRFTVEVRWSAADFAVMALPLAGAMGGYELLIRSGADGLYRAGAAITATGLFLLVWIAMAVGIVGDAGNAANLMFALVVATIVGGAIALRGSMTGMTHTLIAAAGVQLTLGIVALAGGMGREGAGWPDDVIALTGMFTACWLIAALAFRTAGRRA
ncbi:hypothetical protein [Sphingomonas sp.]|uniref:hypothetical protein n=1 Tax=Sphingomonas sp. TaxID=28214 RepID=UPI001ED0C81D|nr:hypothetical protein [Sphingomonas sp.]MBX3594960.1 hypothetical protein [Sphingomonas sp.]